MLSLASHLMIQFHLWWAITPSILGVRNSAPYVTRSLFNDLSINHKKVRGLCRLHSKNTSIKEEGAHQAPCVLQCTVGHCVNMILLQSTTVILIPVMKTYICAYCSVYTISYIQSPLLLVKGVVLNKNRYFLNTMSTRKFWHLCIHTHHSGIQWGICVGIWLPVVTRF